MYLLLAVELTSLMRTKLPKKLWRATHVASFPLFGFATLHALTAGTDAKAWLVQVVAAAATVGIVAMTVLRVKQASRQKIVKQAARRRIVAETPRPYLMSDRVGELVDDRQYAVATADL